MALLSCNGVLELLPHGSRLSCGVRRPPRPDSFKRRLGGFRETQDVAVWVLNVEVPCAPRTLLERFSDRRTAAHELVVQCADVGYVKEGDRKSTRLNSSHSQISYDVFCLKKKTLTLFSFITHKQRCSTVYP